MSLVYVLVTSIMCMPQQQVGAPKELLVMIEEYHVFARTCDPNHPRLKTLRDELRRQVDDDFQFDSAEVEKRLSTLVLGRNSLLGERSFKHPDVVDNAFRISLMSRILAGQSAEVLDDFASESEQH